MIPWELKVNFILFYLSKGRGGSDVGWVKKPIGRVFAGH
jgi:hypothetical protein